MRQKLYKCYKNKEWGKVIPSFSNSSFLPKCMFERDEQWIAVLQFLSKVILYSPSTPFTYHQKMWTWANGLLWSFAGTHLTKGHTVGSGTQRNWRGRCGLDRKVLGIVLFPLESPLWGGGFKFQHWVGATQSHPCVPTHWFLIKNVYLSSSNLI